MNTRRGAKTGAWKWKDKRKSSSFIVPLRADFGVLRKGRASKIPHWVMLNGIATRANTYTHEGTVTMKNPAATVTMCD